MSFGSLNAAMILKFPHPVEFDPSNAEHRKAVAEFIKRGRWSDSPIRFLPPAYGDVGSYVKEKLLEWYLQEEMK